MISRGVAYGDTCCMAGGDGDVVQRHEIEDRELLSLAPTRVAAHEGATVRVTLAG